jgi:hypothetical protein
MHRHTEGDVLFSDTTFNITLTSFHSSLPQISTVYKKDYAKVGVGSKGNQSLVQRWTTGTVDISNKSLVDSDGNLRLKRNVILRLKDQYFRIKCVFTKYWGKWRPIQSVEVGSEFIVHATALQTGAMLGMSTTMSEQIFGLTPTKKDIVISTVEREDVVGFLNIS